MITKKDLDIQNISYTNKDFTQIYPELLDIIKKLTDKWDPETTNESDPGIVLTKLLAFIADKNNYNIDKNVLENFITSCTQEKSMSDICDRLGYNRSYYVSGVCDFSFNYIGGQKDLDELLEKNVNFVIKALDTSFINDDNVVYTLLEDIEISKDIKSNTIAKKVMQGQLKALNLTSAISSNSGQVATKIQLYNLDDNNRIYFPDKMVAENGIFINKRYYNEILKNKNVWRRVYNLNDQDLGQYIYKFGYDSRKGFPYIEFPNDINDLIGDGLEIWYLITNGANGYTGPNTLNSINTLKITTSYGNTINITSLGEDNYSCTNSKSTLYKNPETIAESYNNFKRTVGTFDTLVSCRDYSNALYNYTTAIGDNIVSNAQVTDIRTDPNRKLTILQRDILGSSYYKNIIPANSNYNDLTVHGFKPYNGKIDLLSKYNETYRMLGESDCKVLDEYLQDKKTICHNFKCPDKDSIDHIENKYKLKVNISTNYKVNELEQKSIIKNITNALYENFNSRKLEFGEEIPYDTILNVIQNADERIKLAVLDDPSITSYIFKNTANDYEREYNPFGIHLNIVEENILAGRLPLYENTGEYSLTYKINPHSIKEYKNIIAIDASTVLNPDANGTIKVRDNEVVQVIEDSYIPDVTYPAFVYYALVSNGNSLIPKNVTYKLKENEILYIYYTDSSNNVVIKKYTSNSEYNVVKSTFDIVNNPNTSVSRWLNLTTQEVLKENPGTTSDIIIPLYCIGTNHTIEILKKNSLKLNNQNQYCF